MELLAAIGQLVVAGLREPTTEAVTALGVLELAQKYLDCDQAGITAQDSDGTFRTVACTDPAIEQFDILQHLLGQGPALDSLTKHEDLVVANLTAEPRWPLWRRSVTQLGLHGVATVCLTDPSVPERGRGRVLSLYAFTPRLATQEHLHLARLFACEASVAMQVTHEVWHLNRALMTRTIIGQAEGFLMHRYEIDADQALAVLKRISSQTNRRLHDVAAEVVTTRQLVTMEATAPGSGTESSTGSGGFMDADLVTGPGRFSTQARNDRWSGSR